VHDLGTELIQVDFLFMQNQNGVLQIADDVSNFILLSFS
jgi:hypothetical protein